MNKLFVIPGHGAGDNGSCGNGFKEAEEKIEEKENEI